MLGTSRAQSHQIHLSDDDTAIAIVLCLGREWLHGDMETARPM